MAMNLDQSADKITPSSGTLNIAGAILPTTALAVTNGGTGVITSTGSGNTVLSNSPTLVTPTLGAALATSIKFGSGTVLSYYEEGTFTPSFTGSGGNPTVTYSTQSGKYFRIGNQVTVFIGLVTSAASGGSGNLGISGLPYAVGGAPNNLTSISFAYNFAVGYPQACAVSGSTVVLYSAANANNNTQCLTTTLTVSGAGYLYAGATYTII